MRRLGVPFALIAAALALSACTTWVVNSHRDPSAGKPAFARPLVVMNLSGYALNSEQLRRTGEMELVNELPNMNLVASYRFFSLAELADIGEVKRRASAEGFDSLVLLWVKDVRREWGPDTSLTGRPRLYVRFSAAVLSLPEDLEVWTGVVERGNYGGEKNDARAVARAVARRIKWDGVSDSLPESDPAIEAFR